MAARLWGITRAARLVNEGIDAETIRLAQEKALSDLAHINKELDSYARYDCGSREARRQRRDDVMGGIAVAHVPAGYATLSFTVGGAVEMGDFVKVFVDALLSAQSMENIRIMPGNIRIGAFTLTFDWRPEATASSENREASRLAAATASNGNLEDFRFG
jgi:hypothetical protein